MTGLFSAALEYAKETGNTGALLVGSAVVYLFYRGGAAVIAVAGQAAGKAWTRYDKLLADWENTVRRKEEEIRSKDLRIDSLERQLRELRAESAQYLELARERENGRAEYRDR